MRAILLALVSALGAAVLVLCAPAVAQVQSGGNQVRLIGTVDKLDAGKLTVALPDGKKESVALAADANVSRNVKKTLADVTPGEYVGVTSIKGRNGEDRAIEIRIFDKNRLPSNMSQFPLEFAPDNLMTNAAVAEVTGAADGSVLKVKFSNGESQIMVPPGTPILAAAPGSVDLLKPGTKVTVYATKGADGVLNSRRLSVD
jgi:hypothetical protein